MRRYTIMTLILLFVSSGAFAQKPKKHFFTEVDSLLRKIYMRANYDTTYIERSPGKIGLKAWGNLSGLKFYGRGNGVRADLKTANKATVSAEIDYYDLALEFAFNPAKLSGRNKDFELNVNLYSTRFSFEASYQNAKTLAGDIRRDETFLSVERGWVHTKILNVAAYYTFNFRHFSYDAPFYQLYRQKRSAGSWLAGFSFQGGKLNTTDDLPEGHLTAAISANHVGLGGGYAYNFVVGKHWLFHASATPSLIVWSGDKITINGERRYVDTKFPTVMLNERAAIVYFINPRHFLGANVVGSNLLKYNNITGMRQNKWLVRMFYGVRI